MKVAIVHDWLNQRGGAEGVLEALVSMYPDAPIFTSMYAPEKMPPAYRDWDIRTTWMNRLPGIYDNHQRYLALYPAAFGRLDLSEYDVVISNKSGFCHGVRSGPQTLHICYCLTPTRFLWGYDDYIQRENIGPALASALRPVIGIFRGWDRRAADGVDEYVAISSAVQKRIRRYYERDSTVIFPPVETSRYRLSSEVDNYCLVVSRLVPYKRVDLAVRACSKLGIRLLVAGDGRDRARLEKMAGPGVEFMGRVPDADLPELMAHCSAFIFPGLEDFGIAPVEAQAAGRPVIAFRGGGALDTIIEGETGLFFDEQTPQSLCDTLEALPDYRFDAEVIRANAQRFDTENFVGKLRNFVQEHLREHAGSKGN